MVLRMPFHLPNAVLVIVGALSWLTAEALPGENGLLRLAAAATALAILIGLTIRVWVFLRKMDKRNDAVSAVISGFPDVVNTQKEHGVALKEIKDHLATISERSHQTRKDDDG